MTRFPSVRIGISACLLGQEVRFDGQHKQDRFLTDTLGSLVEWVPVCPEVELGLGIPREPIHLVQIGDDTHLVATRTGRDLTRSMQEFCRRRVAALAEEDLSGFVLKSKSPSCGWERVKIRTETGETRKTGVGLFAAELRRQLPWLPVEEEGRLCDPALRENWIERIFAYRALRDLFVSKWRLADLVQFHTRYKFVLLAHSEKAYRELGRLVANAKAASRAELREQYQSLFMGAMERVATRARHTNVLQHLAGFLKDHLDGCSTRELAEVIEDYRQGHLPLIVPIMLLRHFVRVYQVEYLRQQVYLDPHPKELSLRNHV